jgi:hypothetical protein
MGGLGSGRRRSHTCIVDCLEIDTTWLNKRKLLQRSQGFSMTWRKWTETDFKDRKEREYQAYCLLDMNEHTLTLCYAADRVFESGKKEQHSYSESLSLVSTPCHYGGQRWWFRAPCCYRRVRVLYINLKADTDKMKPMCRDCQDLHYASQCASYIERHITYKKYLLSNYGYDWACDEYHTMKEHHFKVTPEYEYKARRSQLELELELMRLLISSERLLLKTHMRALRSLKSEEDRRMYLKHIASEHGKPHAFDLVHLLRDSIKLERVAHEVSNEVLDRFYAQIACWTSDLEQSSIAATVDDIETEIQDQESKPHMPLDLGGMIERRKELEQKLEELELIAA